MTYFEKLINKKIMSTPHCEWYELRVKPTKRCPDYDNWKFPKQPLNPIEQKPRIAFDYLLQQNCKAYEAVRSAGNGDIDQGLKIMQAMRELEKTICKEAP